MDSCWSHGMKNKKEKVRGIAKVESLWRYDTGSLLLDTLFWRILFFAKPHDPVDSFGFLWGSAFADHGHDGVDLLLGEGDMR